MERLVWLVALVCLLAIVASLGSALWHLSRGTEENSARLARALTMRITLSLVLFGLLMLAWYFGLITPHSFQGGPPPPHP
jgi:hypothetical protein